MIILLYVDDCGIASPDMSEIDAFIDRLKAKGFELAMECDSSASPVLILGSSFTGIQRTTPSK